MPSLPFLVVALLPLVCDASPINRQVGLSENVFMTTQNDTNGLEHRVCSIDAVTYSDGETIPTSSPCEHCVCRPPGFACTITSCEYRPGCKAYRRSDQCCPEYQCECEKDGKIYQNGEKIMDNNNPCEVCYCQGGEIICAVIDCYWRNDCAPRYIDNRCCPMYDHCPPPSGQGPIRHRLPSVPSLTSPISWHNLTQPASSPPPAPIVTSTLLPSTEVTTEAPSTTVSTTVSTTSEAPSSSSVDPISEAVPETENNLHSDEQVHVNDVFSESSPVLPVETTQQSVLDNGLNADQPIVNDEIAENEIPVTSTQQVPLPSESATASSAVIESTTLLIPAALELTVHATSVQPIQILSQATVLPSIVPEISNLIGEIAVNEPINDAATESEPEQQTIQQDESSDAVPTTERQVSDSSSGLRNELESASDSPVANDEVATTVPTIVNEINDDNEVNTNGVVRNDLPEASTQSDLQASEDSVTTPASDFSEGHDAIYSDGIEGTTPRLVLENEIRNDEIEPVSQTTEAAPLPQSDDTPVETVTVAAILHDEPVAVTQTYDGVPLAQDDSNSEIHSDATVSTQQDATETPLLNDDSEDIHISHDDVESLSATESASIVQDTPEEVSNVHDVTENVSIVQDEPEVASLVQAATENVSIVQDSSSVYDVTENVHISHDVLEIASLVQDATENVQIAQDAPEEASPVQDATENVSIVQDATVSASIVQDATEGSSIVQDATENTSIVQDDPEDDSIVHDATESIVQDSPEGTSFVQDATENASIVQDAPEEASPVQDATESAPASQDATESAPAAQDAAVDTEPIIHDATEEAPISHDDIETAEVQDATESAPILQDATESEQVIQDDEDTPTANDDIESDHHATDSPSRQQDSTDSPTVQQDATGTPVHYNANTLNLDATDIPEHVPLFDDATATERDFVTQATVEEDDQPSQDATEESNLALHDDNEAAEHNIVVHDEVTQNYEASHDGVTEKSLQDEGEAHQNEVASQSEYATERNEISHDDVPANSDAIFDGATERILADEVSTELPVSEQSVGVAQDAPATDSPAKPELVETKENEVFDIILDDEVVPEKLEILNQVRDANEIEAERHEAKPVESIRPSSVEETLLEGVRHADSDTVEIINLSAVAPQQPQQPEGSTQTTPQVSSDSNNANDEEASTDSLVEPQQTILSDENVQDVPQTSTSDNLIISDGSSVEATETSFYQFRHDDTLFRADIFRHHLGVPHDDETTTAGPIPSNDDELVEVVLSDEQQTTSKPDESLVVKNKVQKVAEVVAQNNVGLPDSVEATGNKFRLELDIFRGSDENVSNDILTDVRTKEDERESGTTASSLQDFPEVSTEREVQQQDDIVVASQDSAATEPSSFRDDATTPISISQDEQAEVRQESDVENEESVGTTLLPRIGESEQDNEIAQNDAVTTAYSFRMNLPNSLEEDLEEQQDAIPSTQSSILDDVVEQETEGSQILNDEATSAPVTPEVNAIQDEVATESVLKLRSDVDISTELPLIAQDAAEQSTSSNDLESQNDFVEVSTASPSGFALEYREEISNNDEAVTPGSNDEPTIQDENVTPSVQQNELRSEPLVISAEDAGANDGIDSTPVVLSDEAVTTPQPLERLRTESTVVEQQTEVQFLQDNEESENVEVTTETTPPTNNNQSSPIQEKATKEEVILPERGLPKIQPFSPDLSRTNHHELRFDLQLPPEKDNSWLSRAVNQFRRLAMFGNNANKPAAPAKTRMQNHRFLLF